MWGSHSGGYIFWDITPLVRWKPTEISEEHVEPIFRVEDEAKKDSGVKQDETSVDFHRTSRRYIPGDRILKQITFFQTKLSPKLNYLN
jgi:hypothetical protein